MLSISSVLICLNMQLKFRDHPVAATLICVVIAAAYIGGYFTEGHERASNVLRAAPHSYELLVIYSYKWSGDAMRIYYVGRNTYGWRFVRARHDANGNAITIE